MLKYVLLYALAGLWVIPTLNAQEKEKHSLLRYYIDINMGMGKSLEEERTQTTLSISIGIEDELVNNLTLGFGITGKIGHFNYTHWGFQTPLKKKFDHVKFALTPGLISSGEKLWGQSLETSVTHESNIGVFIRYDRINYRGSMDHLPPLANNFTAGIVFDGGVGRKLFFYGGGTAVVVIAALLLHMAKTTR